MAPIIARTKIVAEFGTEYFRNGLVFDEIRMLSIGVVCRERGRRYVFGYPLRISSSAIERRCCGKSRMKVGNGAWEAILEETVRIDGRNDVFESRRICRDC